MILQGLTHVILSKWAQKDTSYLDLLSWWLCSIWQTKSPSSHHSVVATQIFFFIFTPNPGEMIQFDEHIFQLGWFNHQRTIIWENVGLELFSFASWPCKSEQPRNIDRKVKWSKCPTPSVGFHHHYRLGITTPLATIGKSLHVLWKGILYEPWRCPRGLTQCRP